MSASFDIHGVKVNTRNALHSRDKWLENQSQNNKPILDVVNIQ